MKILVTGGAGFIGSHLSEALSGAGHEVTVLDALLSDPYPVDQKLSNWDALGRFLPQINRLQVDLRDPLDADLFADFEIIFHLAAMPGLNLSWSNPKLYIDCNLLATANLLKVCNSLKLKKFVYISTSSVYGSHVLEDELGILSPISPYGVTKLAAEKMVAAYASESDLKFSIFRLFSVYGPRQRSDMAFNIFIDKIRAGEPITIYGDGTQSRANTFVDDVVNGLILGMELSKHQEIFNLSGPSQYSVLEAIGMIGNILETQPNLVFESRRYGDQYETRNSSAKAQALLGYSPKTSLMVGLEKQISWQIAKD